MQKLSCKDLNPDTTCDFTATGDTNEEVVNKMMAHAKAEHPQDTAGMSDADLRMSMQVKVRG